MSTNEVYHVKRAWFCRGGRYLSYTLMLVNSKEPSDSVGRLYRLGWNIGHEMKLSIQDPFDASKSEHYIASVILFSMPTSFLERFNSLVKQTKHPPQPSPLTPINPATARYDEETRRWVADILHSARTQLYKAGLLLDVLDDRSWIVGGKWSVGGPGNATTGVGNERSGSFMEAQQKRTSRSC